MDSPFINGLIFWFSLDFFNSMSLLFTPHIHPLSSNQHQWPHTPWTFLLSRLFYNRNNCFKYPIPDHHFQSFHSFYSLTIDIRNLLRSEVFGHHLFSPYSSLFISIPLQPKHHDPLPPWCPEQSNFLYLNGLLIYESKQAPAWECLAIILSPSIHGHFFSTNRS